MTTLTIDATKVRPELGATVIPATLGEAAAVGKLCYVGDDDLVYQTDADVGGTLAGRLLGILVSGGDNDAEGDIASGGRAGLHIWGPIYLGPSVGLLGSKQYYVSNTKGGIEDAPGTITRRLGSRINATTLFFAPTVAAAGS